jgi:3-oxoadipate enol-lactonase
MPTLHYLANRITKLQITTFYSTKLFSKWSQKMKIEANGISIGYDLTGNPDGAVVTLSHSLATTREMWWPQIESLETNYRVLRYDTRGHGETDGPDEPYSIPLLANDLVALLKALKIDKTHFVGLSMGGMIGQLLAAKHRDLLKTVTLCATTCQMPKEAIPAWDERIVLAGAKGMDALVESTVERWFTRTYIDSTSRGLDRVREMIRQTPPQAFIRCGQTIKVLAQLDMLKKVQSPTLVLVGAEDPSTPPAASKLIKDNIVGAEMEIIGQASHLLNIEQSESFNERLLRFLATH